MPMMISARSAAQLPTAHRRFARGATLLLATLASTAACRADSAPASAASIPGSTAPSAAPAEAPSAAPSAATDPTPAPAKTETPKPSGDETTLAQAKPEPAEPAVAAPAGAEDPGGTAAEAAPVEHKVLILGDSLAATGFGALLERKLDAHPQIVCYRKGKSASGLARPDFFDWPSEAKKQLEFRKPDLVVVIMGGNDGQDMTRKKGKRVAWSDVEAWKTDYRARMDELLGQLVADDREVVWLGLPKMGLRSFEAKLEIIRAVQMDAVAAQGDRARYVDTIPMVTDDSGELLAEAKVGSSRKPQAIRADDRIHFTMSGSEYFADQVYPKVLEALELQDAPAAP